MNFDLRIPLGLMFTIFGAILTCVGIFGSADLTRQSLGINMNLWWGLVQFLFGVVMLLFAFCGGKLAVQKSVVVSQGATRPDSKQKTSAKTLE